MPEMDGKQCLEKLLKMDPNSKVIISTGYSADQMKEVASRKRRRGFSVSLFSWFQMLNTVREVLDKNWKMQARPAEITESPKSRLPITSNPVSIAVLKSFVPVLDRIGG